MKKTNNNRGAAMVTVLIAVAFITIMATSLLYMTYMNYITKALKYGSTDNFYIDEFALDDLSTTLQRTAASANNISEAKQRIKNAVGATDLGGGVVCYDNDSVAALIQVASKEASISVNTAVPLNVAGTPVSSNYIEEADYVKLVGVQITATSEEGYKSTITTDIVVAFPSGGIGDMDINDFSIITDCPVRVVEGDTFFSGNLFCSNQLSGGSGAAFTVETNGNASILSTRGIIYGDLVVNGTGVLNITGDITVLGDIKINDHGVLICTGTLSCYGTSTISSGARLVGITEGDIATVTTDPSTVIPSAADGGLTGRLFEDVWVYDGSGNWYLFSVEDFMKYGRLSYSGTLGGTTIYSVIDNETPLNNSYNNTLVLSPNRSTEIKGQLTNSTVICTMPIQFTAASMPTYMQYMSDEAYEFAKGTMITGTITHPDDSAIHIQFSGGATGRAEGMAPYNSAAGDLQHSGGVSAIYRNHANELPFGSLIAEDSAEVITSIFNVYQGTPEPTRTSIIYENWIKN